ncbi:LOW QUALITY PROTEIN: hypothetical protein KUTeg_019160 [Tegillarca granosa]|uniref:Ankyrin repeat domain-containing protein 27 n=1 Tax=Tegillarca granosa TaxID=220873 RepID=A0ABQ9EBQ4_TEGGR|nr:LOW QUALITY PROTEIN: hypothetical protein KUTeg_019160 [Tegillarca granosa]
MAKYDEDLYENPFFVAIQTQFQHLYEEASTKRCIFCIPRFSMVEKEKFTLNDVKDHIIDSHQTEENTYSTYSGKKIQILDGKIKLLDFSEPKNVEILFEETFYNNADESYRVLCVNCMLNREYGDTLLETVTRRKRPDSFVECKELLFGHAGGRKTQETLDKLFESFASSYFRLMNENFRNILDAASAQFTTAMQIVLKDTTKRRSVQTSKDDMNNLKLAVETYMMDAIHKQLFQAVATCFSNQDAEINKMTRNMFEIKPSDLGIHSHFEKNIKPGIKELLRLNTFSTPIGKLKCIKRVVTALSRRSLKINDSALEHIRSGQQKEDFKNSYKQKEMDLTSRTTTVEKFFQYVQLGDEAAVRQMLAKPKDDIALKLCHPLCTSLHIAALHGQAHLIDVLVKNGALVDACDYLAYTPLHLACQKGYQNIIGRCDINATNYRQDTPLHMASKWGYEGIVNVLLENGARTDLKNRKKQTAFSLAQNAKVQQLFYENEKRPRFMTQRPISKSMSDYEVITVKKPKVPNASVSEPSSLSTTPLNTPEIASLDQLENKQRDLLYKAIGDGDEQLVKFYFGWNKDSDDEDELSPTVTARELCHPLCQCSKCSPVQQLSVTGKNGIHINTQNPAGFTPLHLSVLHANLSLVKMFVKRGADVNIKSKKEITALHLSCYLMLGEIASYLIQHGAKVNIKDNAGDSPLHLCVDKECVPLLYILIQHGANVNSANNEGNTPLHKAVYGGKCNIVKKLLNSGANMSCVNKENLTPIQISQDPEITKLLLDHQKMTKEIPESNKGSEKSHSSAHSPENKASSNDQSSIQKFDAAVLRRVESKDRSEPLYNYSLVNSASQNPEGGYSSPGDINEVENNSDGEIKTENDSVRCREVTANGKLIEICSLKIYNNTCGYPKIKSCYQNLNLKFFFVIMLEQNKLKSFRAYIYNVIKKIKILFVQCFIRLIIQSIPMVSAENGCTCFCGKIVMKTGIHYSVPFSSLIIYHIDILQLKKDIFIFMINYDVVYTGKLAFNII